MKLMNLPKVNLSKANLSNLPKVNLTDLSKDILVLIGLELENKKILNYSLLSKRFNNVICNNYSFWYQKLKRDYGFTYVGIRTLVSVKEYYGTVKDLLLNFRLKEAAKLGDKEAIDNAIQKGANSWNLGMDGAAVGGHKDLIEFFIQKGADKWNWGMSGAAWGGNKDLVEFFIQKGADKWHYGMIYAEDGGHKDLVDFFESKM